VNADELTGRVSTHIAQVADPQCALHAQVIAAFLNMRRAARADGFDLKPISGFRDYSRQLAIWNGKFTGQRPMLDASGGLIDVRELQTGQRIDAILLWSALPGASRHHWGTDVDLIDGHATPPGYHPQLNSEEFSPGGPYAALADWLQSHAARFGFFRPYQGVLSGVRPEPWHFSFAPIADNARRSLSPAVLREAIGGSPLLGKDQVLARLEELHARYVAAIDWP
jgi:LAS superfamily LD-carboxypeptidase LdcB